MPKITSLPEDTSVALTDLITTVKASGTLRNKKVFISNLFTAMGYVAAENRWYIERTVGSITSDSQSRTIYIRTISNVVGAVGPIRGISSILLAVGTGSPTHAGDFTDYCFVNTGGHAGIVAFAYAEGAGVSTLAGIQGGDFHAQSSGDITHEPTKYGIEVGVHPGKEVGVYDAAVLIHNNWGAGQNYASYIPHRAGYAIFIDGQLNPSNPGNAYNYYFYAYNGLTGIPDFVIDGSGRFAIGKDVTDTTRKLDIIGGWFRTTYNTTALPASDAGGGIAIGWNKSNGLAEANLYNVYVNGAGFEFWQMTGVAAASQLAQFALTTGDGETALLIRCNVGAAYSVQRVSMGVGDSGGSGYKLLRVPN